MSRGGQGGPCDRGSHAGYLPIPVPGSLRESGCSDLIQAMETECQGGGLARLAPRAFGRAAGVRGAGGTGRGARGWPGAWRGARGGREQGPCSSRFPSPPPTGSGFLLFMVFLFRFRSLSLLFPPLMLSCEPVAFSFPPSSSPVLYFLFLPPHGLSVTSLDLPLRPAEERQRQTCGSGRVSVLIRGAPEGAEGRPGACGPASQTAQLAGNTGRAGSPGVARRAGAAGREGSSQVSLPFLLPPGASPSTQWLQQASSHLPFLSGPSVTWVSAGLRSHGGRPLPPGGSPEERLQLPGAAPALGLGLLPASSQPERGLSLALPRLRPGHLLGLSSSASLPRFAGLLWFHRTRLDIPESSILKSFY